MSHRYGRPNHSGWGRVDGGGNREQSGRWHQSNVRTKGSNSQHSDGGWGRPNDHGKGWNPAQSHRHDPRGRPPYGSNGHGNPAWGRDDSSSDQSSKKHYRQGGDSFTRGGKSSWSDNGHNPNKHHRSDSNENYAYNIQHKAEGPKAPNHHIEGRADHWNSNERTPFSKSSAPDKRLGFERRTEQEEAKIGGKASSTLAAVTGKDNSLSTVPKALQQAPHGSNQIQSEDMLFRLEQEKEQTQTSSSSTGKKFEDMTKREKLMTLVRFPEEHNWSRFPEEAFVEDSDEWNERKRDAAEFAITQVMTRMREEAMAKIAQMEHDTDDDDDDDDDSYGFDDPYADKSKSRRPADHFPYSHGTIKKIFHAVPECLFLTLGFNVFGLTPGDDKNCICPFGADMIKWQQQFGVAGFFEHEKDRKYRPCRQKKDPIGIMSHLRKIADEDILHYGLQCYMEHLYDKEMRFGKPGHKAMYQMNDKFWKEADAEEKRKTKMDIARIKTQLVEERNLRLKAETKQEEQRKAMELLERINEESFKKIKELQKCREDLHVEPKKEVVITPNMLTCYRNLYLGFFRSIKNESESKLLSDQRLKKVPGFEKSNYDRLGISVGQKVVLPDLFNSWFVKSKQPPKQQQRYRKEASLLFRSLDLKEAKGEAEAGNKNYYGYKIIRKWNVEFKNELQYKDRKAQKQENTAIDEGGPTREFLSQCWNQLGDLTIKVGTAEIELFERTQGGFLPETDDKLRNKFMSALNEHLEPGVDVTSESLELVSRAKVYYRAVGRILLHALSNKHPIFSIAVPALLQNYLFRGCRPGDEDYHRDDVIKHVHAIGCPFKFDNLEELDAVADYDEPLTNDTVFTKLIPDYFLKERQLALDAIEEGLTLGGTYKVTDIFRAMPLEALQKVIFSVPTVSAEAIIAILEPKYCEGVEEVDDLPADIIELQKIQEDFFKGTLRDVLRDREKSTDNLIFFSRFVAFCTGFMYLPDPDGNPGFKITVEFNIFECEKGDLPMSHACVNTLKLPGHLYSDRDEFEQRLDKALECSEGSFQMQ